MKLTEASPYQYLRTPEYRHIPQLRILNFIYLGIFFLILSGTIFFLYDTISTTLGRIASITSMASSGLGFQAIDLDRLQQVEAAWQKKHMATPLTITRNPFELGADTATTTPAAPPPKKHKTKTR